MNENILLIDLLVVKEGLKYHSDMSKLIIRTLWIEFFLNKITFYIPNEHTIQKKLFNENS